MLVLCFPKVNILHFPHFRGETISEELIYILSLKEDRGEPKRMKIII